MTIELDGSGVAILVILFAFDRQLQFCSALLAYPLAKLVLSLLEPDQFLLRGLQIAVTRCNG